MEKANIPSFDTVLALARKLQQAAYSTVVYGDFASLRACIDTLSEAQVLMRDAILEIDHPRHTHPPHTVYISVGKHFVPGSIAVPINSVCVTTVTNSEGQYAHETTARYDTNNADLEKVKTLHGA